MPCSPLHQGICRRQAAEIRVMNLKIMAMVLCCVFHIWRRFCLQHTCLSVDKGGER